MGRLREKIQDWAEEKRRADRERGEWIFERSYWTIARFQKILFFIIGIIILRFLIKIFRS